MFIPCLSQLIKKVHHLIIISSWIQSLNGDFCTSSISSIQLPRLYGNEVLFFVVSILRYNFYTLPSLLQLFKLKIFSIQFFTSLICSFSNENENERSLDREFFSEKSKKRIQKRNNTFSMICKKLSSFCKTCFFQCLSW